MPISTTPVTLRPLTELDLPLLHDWLNRPHIVDWWGGERPTLDEVQAHYHPQAMAAERVTPYIAMQGDVPIGYAQSYVAMGSSGGWWVDVTDPGVRGIDQSLADEALLSRGLGTQMVRALVDLLFRDPAVTRIQTDPAPHNLRAIRCYEKAGFRAVRRIVTPDGPALYMLQDRPASSSLQFRPLVAADQAQLWHWLHVALWDPPPAGLRPLELLQHPGARIYAEDWGRPGDVGVVAQVDGADAGACWLRLLPLGVGLGSVDAATPQLGIALEPAYQHRGLGQPLMRAALAAARDAGYERVSLTVHPENPARHLYERCGFRTLELRHHYRLMIVDLASSTRSLDP